MAISETKKKEERKKETTGQKYNGLRYSIGRPQKERGDENTRILLSVSRLRRMWRCRQSPAQQRETDRMNSSITITTVQYRRSRYQ